MRPFMHVCTGVWPLRLAAAMICRSCVNDASGNSGAVRIRQDLTNRNDVVMLSGRSSTAHAAMQHACTRPMSTGDRLFERVHVMLACGSLNQSTCNATHQTSRTSALGYHSGVEALCPPGAGGRWHRRGGGGFPLMEGGIPLNVIIAVCTQR